MRGEGGSQGGKEEPAGEPERRGNSRLRYIFRTVPNAVVTRRCHCAWYPGLLLAPHHAATATRGTAPDTPLSNESTQFDGARRALSLHLGPLGIGVVSFSAVSSAHFSLTPSLSLSLSLSLSPSLPLSFTLTAAPLFPPLLPYPLPTQRGKERERERERALGRARARANPLPLPCGLSISLLFSRSHSPPSYPRGRISVVSQPRRAPHSHSIHARRRAASLPRWRSSGERVPLAHNPSTKRTIRNN